MYVESKHGWWIRRTATLDLVIGQIAHMLMLAKLPKKHGGGRLPTESHTILAERLADAIGAWGVSPKRRKRRG